MKKIIITTTLVLLSISLFSQDQTVNGKLSVTGDISVGTDVSGKRGEGTRLYLRGTDSSNDPVWLAKYTASQEYTDLRINVGDALDPKDRFIVGTTQWDTKQWYDLFVVRMDGNVGVGVSQPTCKLDINGTIRSKEVKIEATGWADFVFDRDYKLPSLSQVESHINENKTLPGIPTEQQVKENGIDLGDMQIKLLQKIEELTLYVIDQNKRIKALEEENKNLKNTQP